VCLGTNQKRGGTAGGSGADRGFLVPRRIGKRNNSFSLKHLAQANGVKKFEKSAFLFGSRGSATHWIAPAGMQIVWWAKLLEGRAAGVFGMIMDSPAARSPRSLEQTKWRQRAL